MAGVKTNSTAGALPRFLTPLLVLFILTLGALTLAITTGSVHISNQELWQVITGGGEP
ncbi:MAG: hypothetical protein ACJAU3_001505, partial [Zhongshania sp.]